MIAIPPDFRNLADLPNVRIDLRYASPNNFTGKDLYGNFRQAFLHEIAFEQFRRATKELQNRKPGFSFLVFDALRPRSSQRVLFSYVVGTPQEKYVANPDRGSIHNYGFAIDLSLADEHGQEVNMGSGFDDFREISQPQLEAHFLKTGELSEIHFQNRLLLRECMRAGGFTVLPHEWWHFEARAADEVRAHFAIVE